MKTPQVPALPGMTPLGIKPKSPSDYAKAGDPYDCTGEIGPFSSDAAWPMFSYERPAYIVWNAIAAALHARGWSDDEIKGWLQSKNARWALDGYLGDILIQIGTHYAVEMIRDEDKVS
jgi:hypothetical protein